MADPFIESFSFMIYCALSLLGGLVGFFFILLVSYVMAKLIYFVIERWRNLLHRIRGNG